MGVNQLALFGEGAESSFHAFPFDGGAGCFDGARGGKGHFGPDSIAGDECNEVGHL